MRNIKKITRKSLLYLHLLTFIFIFAVVVESRPGSVDLSFNAVPAKVLTRDQIQAPKLTVQSDGRVLVFGEGNNISRKLIRFNQDGSLDTSFSCAECGSLTISSVAVQPDGKIVVAGSSPTVIMNEPYPGAFVRRLNADGTLDSTFAGFYIEPTSAPSTSTATVWAILPNGKPLISISAVGPGLTVQRFIYYVERLNPNGGLDGTFSRIVVGDGTLTSVFITKKVAVQSDGKILVASNSSLLTNPLGARLNRYHQDGTLDPTFAPPSIAYNVNPNFVRLYDVVVGANDQIFLGGVFSSVNAVSLNNLAKLSANGAVDTTFVPSAVLGGGEEVGEIAVVPNNRLIVSTQTRFFRLNEGGAVDNTFASPANVLQVGDWSIDQEGRIVFIANLVENDRTVLRLARSNADGTLDNSFSNSFDFGIVNPGSISQAAVQPDGKVVVAGDFSQVNGLSRPGFARLNSDGSGDPTFNPGSGFLFGTTRLVPRRIVVQTDGKILVSGSFSSYNGTPFPGLVRLNHNGSIDTTFNPSITSPIVGGVFQVGIRPDGKIVIIGNFQSVNGIAAGGIARLNADGSSDASFVSPVFNGSGFPARAIVQTDGKIVVIGNFTTVNGINRSGVARLNANGSLDESFNAGGFFPMLQLADGKYIATGNDAIRRLNNDGTVDNTFGAATFQGGLSAIFAQPDGKIIIGGSFENVNGVPRSNIARLKTDGTVDTDFAPLGADDFVEAIVGQPNGKIIITGRFTSVGGVARNGIARLNTVSSAQFDFDGDGKADVSVFRPSNGAWYLQQSASGFTGVTFGFGSDRIVPADYDGDGKTDVAVYRPANGTWYLQRTQLGFTGLQFGAADDVPVPADYDGDGRADVAVFRPSNGTWYIQQSALGFVGAAFGASGDRPVAADYDGDGKADIAVFRPSNGTWYLRRSNLGFVGIQFGEGGDKAVPADYDGDGRADVAAFRPSNGTWYLYRSGLGFAGIQFGDNLDLPAPADYDGDGRADVAVYRPSNGTWYLKRSVQGFTGVTFGASEDKPIPNAFVP